MPTFIGLDLAWTAHREAVPFESGLCVLEGRSGEDLRCSRIEASRLHVTALADELLEVAHQGSPVIAAIDAPLVVTAERRAESALNREFGRFHAGAYHANLAWLERKDLKAGPLLGGAIKTRGFVLDPSWLQEGSPVERVALEVFPHTIHVRLFELEKRLTYKKGRVEVRRQGMKEYQRHLFDWLRAHAPGVLQSSAVRASLDNSALEDLPGSSRTKPSLKHYEDMLDGLTCALAAWLLWREPDRWETFGDANNGYIVAPRAPDERAPLA